MSSSIFTCVPYVERKSSQPCIFAGVSACSDLVSPRICNGHAAIFGLYYQKSSYTNGHNESWSKIDTYIITPTSLNIPLFHDGNQTVFLDEVHTFVLDAKQRFPSIRTEDLENKIAALLGLTAYDCNLYPISWIDKDKSALIAIIDDKRQYFVSTLPLLHRILFAHTEPSLIKNNNKTSVLLVPNVALVLHNNNRFAFKMINPEITLKHTKHENARATPIVLAGCRNIAEYPDRTFRTIRPSVAC
jgi:hypothetical protein